MTRIAIIGAAGQLGSELRKILPTDTTFPLDRRAIDIVDRKSIAAALDPIRPQLVINAAAYNFVDRAEDEPQIAYAANALGPRNLALWCESADVALVHVSTDYVFRGWTIEGGRKIDRRTPYGERDAPLPPNAYGVSKLAGECFVRGLCSKHFVVRTCGLYGQSKGSKGNFVETMLRLGHERNVLRVVNDQHCTPTSAADLAEAIVALANTDAYGLYHVTNDGETTWHGFASEIFRQARLEVDTQEVTSADYGAAAPRPAYSVLDCRKVAGILRRPLPSWQDALARYLRGRSTL